jgi:hypothetical protein
MVDRVNEGHDRRDGPGLVGLEVTDEVPLDPWQVRQGLGLRDQLLRVVLSESAMPGGVGVTDGLGGMTLRYRQQPDVVGRPLRGERRRRDAPPYEVEALRDAGQARLRAYQIITSLPRCSGPPWKSPSTASTTKPP